MGRYHDRNNSNIRWCFLLRKRDLFYGLILLVPSLFLGLLLRVQRSMQVLSLSPTNSSSSRLLEEGYLQHDIISTTKWTSVTAKGSSTSSLQPPPVRQDNPTIVSSPSSFPPRYWDLSNPKWPLEPPTLLPDCKVVFRQNNNNNSSSDDMLLPQRLCHIVPWGANFGDELGPPIVMRILELYFHCSAQDLPTLNLAPLTFSYMNRSSSIDGDGPCLLSVGSMWRMAQSGDHLWGTGVAFDGTVKHRCTRDNKYRLTNLTIYSSRGPNSVAQIHKYCPFAAIASNNNINSNSSTGKTIPSAGDAGFLVPYLFPEYAPRDTWLQRKEMTDTTTTTTNSTTTNSSRMCIIPHHDERNNPQFRMAERQHGAIRLTVQQPWQTMVASLLTKCDTVLSSSLHGLILAEALGIASKRFQLTQKPGNFKFDDFYRSYRGPVQGSDGSDSSNGSSNGTVITMEHLYARNLTAAMNDWLQPLSIQQRDAYARRILETFPIHLFETVQVKRT
jgi:hypothetical protein